MESLLKHRMELNENVIAWISNRFARLAQIVWEAMYALCTAISNDVKEPEQINILHMYKFEAMSILLPKDVAVWNPMGYRTK